MTVVQVIGLNAIFSFGTERFKCFSSHNMFAYFTPSTSTAAFILKRISIKLLALPNPIIGIFLKTYCVLCQVLAVSVFQVVYILNFKNTG